MKKLIKLTLVVALVLSSTSLFAQKMGRINSQELISLMPETTQMQTDLQTYATELNAQIEEVQVELNNKFADFQKKQATMKDLERQVAEKEMNELGARLEQFRQVASEDFAKQQQELFAPIQEKAMAAIEKVAKAGGYAVVIDLAAGSMIYIDEAQVADILPAVKAELGIK